MIDLGAIYPAAVNVYDQSKNLVNAATVTLTITQPDQTIVQPVVLNPPAVTGQYFYPFQTVQPGRHLVNWNTLNPVVAWSDVFDVGEAAPPSIISLADAKQTLGMPPSYTDDDDELRAKLRAATRAIERYKHEVYAYRTITETALWAPVTVPWTQGMLRLTYVPVISLVSLVSLNPPVGGVQQIATTYDVVNNIYLDNDTGLITVINGPPLAGRLQSVYNAGMMIIPYEIIEGCKVLLQFLWQTRRGPGGLSGVVGPEELGRAAAEQLLPKKVRDWVGPPRPTVY